MDLVVRRTKGASPAFIRELMRRSAQFQIEQGGAIEEMVFIGGALNLKLLGGAAAEGERRRRSKYLRSPRKPLKSWPRIDIL